jgi:iron complex outermembrane receptor protein
MSILYSLRCIDSTLRIRLLPAAVFAFASTGAFSQAGVIPAAPDSKRLENLQIEDLFKLTVSAVSRHAQPLSDAPASVTVVTAEDIRKFGYRTLADVIGSIKGTYISNDRVYQYFGGRGFARAGDLSTRVLLLVDGNRINDNVFDQAIIGSEFPLEIESVERVEFVPGPGSALYGSNAFFGVINVITRHDDSKPGTRGVIKTDSQNRWVAWAGHTGTFGQDGQFSLDVAKRGGSGPSHFYSALNSSATNYGRESGVDFEDAHRLWFKVSSDGFSASVISSDRRKGLSGAPYGVAFNDPASLFRDALTLVDVAKNFAVSDQLDASVRGFWGENQFQGVYAYSGAPANRDLAQGHWHGSEARFTWRGARGHTVLAGLDYQRDSKVYQRNFDVDPFALYLNDNRPRSRFAFYVQDEWRLGGTILSLGIRHDRATDSTANTNPRMSWVLPFGSGYVFKSVFGTAFRAPNAYEKYWYVSSFEVPQKASPDLKPERIRNIDLILERSFGSWTASLDAYSYRMTKLIQQIVDPADGNAVFANISGVRGKGLDAEVRHRWANGADLQMSVSLQDVREMQTGDRSVNSPSRIAKLRASLPIVPGGTTLAFDIQGISRRMVESGTVPGHASANLVVGGYKPVKGLEFGLGIYNLFNATVLHPVADSVYAFNAMQQDRRHVQLWIRGQL